MPLHAEPALVRPRIVGDDNQPVRLEDEIRRRLQQGVTTRACLVGPTGSGKHTAMRHLLAMFADEPRFAALAAAAPAPAAAIVTVRADLAPAAGELAWPLLPWHDDDCRDYLQQRHPATAAVAFAAWQHPAPIHDLRHWPGLCSAVLDHLAHVAATHDDASGTDALCALAFVLAGRLGQRRAAVCSQALASFAPPPARPMPAADASDSELLECLTVRALLAAEELLRCAAERGEAPFAPRAWPEPLVAATAHLLHADPTLLHRLITLSARPPRRMALLTSLLCAAIDGYRPLRHELRDLAGARLPRADLHDFSLRLASLDGAMLDGADLRRADCRGMRAAGLRARGLTAAGLRADAADLTGADLQNADLTAASLGRCKLAGADLTGAHLVRADLQHADLRGAQLDSADLGGARLDGADFGDADLRTCNLAGASLTGARMAATRLSPAELERARHQHAALHGEASG